MFKFCTNFLKKRAQRKNSYTQNPYTFIGQLTPRHQKSMLFPRQERKAQ